MHTIQASTRTAGSKGAARALRRSGRMPAVVYGSAFEPTPVAIDPSAVVQLYESGNDARIIQLTIDGGEPIDVILKDVQIDPLHRKFIHADFLAIAEDRKIQMRIPVVLEGTARGIEMGGILQFSARELTVESLPADLPEAIRVDISSMDVGQRLLVRDLPLPKGVRVIDDPARLVVTILRPTVRK